MISNTSVLALLTERSDTSVQMAYELFRLVVNHGQKNEFQTTYIIISTEGWAGANQKASAYVNENFRDALWHLSLVTLINDDGLLDTPVMLSFGKRRRDVTI